MERKKYLGLGIILAIFAALVSLMCIAFSYADVNELNAEDNAADPQVEAIEDSDANDKFTITLNISAPADSYSLTYGGSLFTGTTITTEECVSYSLSAGTDSAVVTINDGTSKDLIVNLNSGYVSSG